MYDRYKVYPSNTVSAMMKTKNPAKPRNPIKTSIPVVRQLMELIERKGWRIRGVPGEDRIYKWRAGRSGPQLQAFMDLADNYGQELMLVPKTQVAAVQALLAGGTPATPRHGVDTSSGAAGGPGTTARAGQRQAA